MAYVKQNFKDGSVLTAAQLNAMENGIVAASKDFNFWADKTMVCVGDSITAGSGTTQTYWSMLKDILGLSKMTGMGVGGSCVSAKSDYGTGNSPLINRWNNIPEADLITIFMGTNDWGHETPLGTIEDTTDVSFYGALNVIIPGLMTKYPNARIIWITPMHRYGFGTSKILGTRFTFDHLPNGRDCTLEDYVNAIKDVCSRWSIPVIDLYSMSGLHPYIAPHKSTYMPDGLHPNKAGHEKMAYLISKWLQIYANNEIVSTDPVTGINLDITSTPLQVNKTVTVVASITPLTASNKNITWAIKSGSSYATITSSSGSTCTVKGVADGTAVLAATTEDGGFVAECTLNVTSSNIPVTGVTISSATQSIGIGGNTTLTANITPAAATNQNVSWLIVSGTEYITISPNGLNCSVTGAALGTATISVTTQDGTFTAEYDISVEDGIASMTMDYGNPFGATDQQTSKGRLHSTTALYCSTGTTIELIDNITYKWALRKVTSENDFTTVEPSYQPESAWSSKKSYTTTSDGYWLFIVLKADNSDFNLSTDSNRVANYFKIT